MPRSFYKTAGIIDEAASRYAPENLECIESCFDTKGAERYFFRESLIKIENCDEWLVPLKEKGYFSGDKNPPPRELEGQPGGYVVPVWDVLPYLERVAEENNKRSIQRVSDVIIEIMDGIIGYRNGGGQRIENYRTDWFMVKILSRLPTAGWEARHIDFIGLALDARFGMGVVDSEIGKRVLPTLINAKRCDLIMRLLDVILSFKVKDDNAGEVASAMDEHWLKDTIGGKNRERIADLCGPAVADVTIKKMQELAEHDQWELSTVWVPSIELSSQTSFPDRYGYQLVSFARDLLEKADPEDARVRVEGLLKQKHSVFKRLGVHVTNHHWEQLQDLFWNWQGNPLQEHELHHELYVLLVRRCTTFTDAQMEQVLAWIKEIEFPNPDEPKKDAYEARMRKRWLSALSATNDPKVEELLEVYDEKAPGKDDHPSFPTWSESGWVSNKSPKSLDELLAMTNGDIATFLKEWREEDTFSLERVSAHGLSVALCQTAREHPDKFADDMTPFHEVQMSNQHDVLRGLTEAWNAKAKFAVDKVLTFIEELIALDGFWETNYAEHEANYRNYVVREIAEFIEAGTQTDEHAFAPDCLAQIERILLVLIEKAESVVHEESDIVNSVLTSPRACVFSAAILYAVRHARLYKKEEQRRWPDAIRNAFTDRLDPATESPIDFWVTLGKYIPNLPFLDNEWVHGEIDRIFPKGSQTHWVAAFGAYLSYSPHVYEEIYVKLRERGHYQKGLETDFQDTHIAQKLIQHICIAFLEDWEKVSDKGSLIARILELAKPSHLSEVVHFLGGLEGDEPRNKLKVRIKPLWQAMFELLREKQEEPEYQGVISDLYRWLGIVDQIDDDIRDWSLLTAKHIRVHWHDSGLVEELAKHVKITPAAVAEIYLAMLDAKVYPNYDQNHIRAIVESLYEHECKQQADTICNKYGEVGDYSLRDLYEKYSQTD